MDRGAWWATVHGVAKSWTRLSNFHFRILHQPKQHSRKRGQNKDNFRHVRTQKLSFFALFFRKLVEFGYHKKRGGGIRSINRKSQDLGNKIKVKWGLSIGKFENKSSRTTAVQQIRLE